MSFRYKDPVEICWKSEGFPNSYYPATLLAAVGRTKYIVQYKSRYTQDGKRYLTETVDEEDIRPVPPDIKAYNFQPSARVDFFIDGCWRVGTVTRKVDPNYMVVLDNTQNEIWCFFYRLRPHMDWVNGNWDFPGMRPRGEDKQSSAGQSSKDDDNGGDNPST
ncbi:Agenet-like domain [Dillenia turbinata]|uniref:Agenet-like domain n=1 Tax=Dillenia turbinata TaxID=194707 RepID=A0AAN8UU78_9MAGN